MIKIKKEIFDLDLVYNTKSFNRAKNILGNIDKIGNNEANIEVDTVLYIKNPQGEILHEGDFVGKQINVQMLYVKEGVVQIEHAKKAKLKMKTKYRMTEDEELYSGTGETVDINSNEIAIIDLDEAFKIKNINSNNYMLVHISKYGGIK